MVWIKICGNTNLEDALASVEAGASALGFIFAPSPRRIAPQPARDIVRQLPATVDKVGVFVNESAARIREIVRRVGLTAVQLHGDETLDFAQHLFPAANKPVRVYQAISMKSLFAPGGGSELLDQRSRKALDGVLVDSGSPTRRGGTGLTFDWTRSQPFIESLKRAGYKVIVAGGLTPDNVARALELFRPWGVDVASGVEREPGKKDMSKVRELIHAVRSADVSPARGRD